MVCTEKAPASQSVVQRPPAAHTSNFTEPNTYWKRPIGPIKCTQTILDIDDFRMKAETLNLDQWRVDNGEVLMTPLVPYEVFTLASKLCTLEKIFRMSCRITLSSSIEDVLRI